MQPVTDKHRNLFISVRFHDYETDDFNTGSVYNYWINTDRNVKKGDYLILKDDEANWDALKVVRVEHAEEVQPGKEYPKALTKALIGTADCDAYFGRRERKRKAKEIMQQIEKTYAEEIMQQIEKTFAEAEKMMLYTKLAESNEQMRSLLDQYNELVKDD